MNPEERSEAIFGAFDGVVSVIGFVFALLVHHATETAIFVGGLGGAVSATISMGTGTFEAVEGTLGRRLRLAGVMSVATLVGSLLPVWPYLVLSRTPALIVGGASCLVAAGWIGYEKRRGVWGYVKAYVTVLGAAGAVLVVVALIPTSA